MPVGFDLNSFRKGNDTQYTDSIVQKQANTDTRVSV